MKIEPGKTYRDQDGDLWKILFPLVGDDKITPMFVGISDGVHWCFDEAGISRNRLVRLVEEYTEPKLVPFTSDTFPLDAWLRLKGKVGWYRVTAISDDCVGIPYPYGLKHYSWAFLLEHFEYSTDGCKTWQPCGMKV